jgi:hypothetical protein
MVYTHTRVHDGEFRIMATMNTTVAAFTTYAQVAASCSQNFRATPVWVAAAPASSATKPMRRKQAGQHSKQNAKQHTNNAVPATQLAATIGMIIGGVHN